ncbi:MAG: phage tail assembly chaperone [Parasphingorhabdus sp.]|uniref:phage tail assembly chaperone n=1 Tax=Parasphingorhabdus sp. TaxID=2709688 RepID=UPI003297FDB6
MKATEAAEAAAQPADFSTIAAELCGWTSAQLGWTPQQFWLVTPAELSAIFSANLQARRTRPAIEPLRFAQLLALEERLNHGRRN